MKTAQSIETTSGMHQFALATLLEFITICAIIAALLTQIGIASGIFLMLFALALAARRGFVSLAMLAAASLAADFPPQPNPDPTFLRQLIVLLAAGSLCAWYRLRRGRFH